MKNVILIGLSLAGLAAAQMRTVFPNCVSGPLASNKVCDRTLSPSVRASALVDAMTTDEKLQNLVSKSQGAPRLGLPFYNWWSEALHGIAYAPGVRYADAEPFNASTVFPMPVLMAASFDDELIEKIGTAIGIEARAWGNYGYAGVDYWTPNVNPFKDPRWGRGAETPGEDVLRVKRYADSMVRGLQGNKREKRIIATCKHYAGNDFEDWNGTTRYDFNAKITPQDLSEYYLAPFQQCTRDSKAGSIMCAYNAVNGVPSCANTYLMQTILREHWGWTENNNYITSDCEAVLAVSLSHKYAKTNAEATGICFTAGMDNSCEYEGSSDIPGAWSGGYLKIDTVNRALKRLYEGLIRTGYFDGSNAEYFNLGWKEVNTPENQKLALQSAVEGIVLLKNDGTLPLNLKKGTKVAMIGFWADDETKLSGGYNGRAPFLHTPAYAARQMGLNVIVANGPVLQNSSVTDTWTADALQAAKNSDYIIYFGGLDTSAAGETRDRYSLEWPRAQTALIEKLSKVGKPLVIMQMGDQLDDTDLFKNKKINAIMWASFPGQDGGPAVMTLLSGKKSPSGRLTISQYPASYTSEIPMTEMNLRPTGKYPGRTYRWYDKTIKPFGFGLHYTTFKVSFDDNLRGKPPGHLRGPVKYSIQQMLERCRNKYPDTCPFEPLKIKVTNTGKMTSDYAALAFLSGKYGPPPYPIKTLATYGRRRDIRPGQTVDFVLNWTLGNIARVDENGNTVLYPGKYTISVDEPTLASSEFELTGKVAVLDAWPAPPK
ncbi:hypothetical protein HK098_005551 [Nowakowskiella sp. JEL0407]|nr:hypothetical protein HK098_005551 [Nowakowskiella sp. JEL0407]